MIHVIIVLGLGAAFLSLGLGFAFLVARLDNLERERRRSHDKEPGDG